MALISYSMSMVVTDGPVESASGQVTTEAFDKVDEVLVEHGSAPVEVNVQPSGEGEVKAIMITSDNYADLTFTVDEGIVPVVLDKPLLLVGGLIGLLGATQKVFTFINAGTSLDANVTILVARNAIEPQGN